MSSAANPNLDTRFCKVLRNPWSWVIVSILVQLGGYIAAFLCEWPGVASSVGVIAAIGVLFLVFLAPSSESNSMRELKRFLKEQREMASRAAAITAGGAVDKAQPPLTIEQVTAALDAMARASEEDTKRQSVLAKAGVLGAGVATFSAGFGDMLVAWCLSAKTASLPLYS